jgi:hypothetical protein
VLSILVEDGVAAGIYMVRNPAKLTPRRAGHADALSAETSLGHPRICVPSERPAAVSQGPFLLGYTSFVTRTAVPYATIS